MVRYDPSHPVQNKRLDEVVKQMVKYKLWLYGHDLKQAIDAAAPLSCSYSVFPRLCLTVFPISTTHKSKHAERGKQTASASLVHRLPALYHSFYSYDISLNITGDGCVEPIWLSRSAIEGTNRTRTENPTEHELSEKIDTGLTNSSAVGMQLLRPSRHSVVSFYYCQDVGTRHISTTCTGLPFQVVLGCGALPQGLA
jgi:hypothetical protein